MKLNYNSLAIEVTRRCNSSCENFCMRGPVQNLDINNDPINDKYMILIYNVIEFVQNYLKSEKEKLQFLLWYLERFSSLSKNKTNFLLFKYYRGALHLQLGDISTANTEYLEFVMQYTEEIISDNSENKYTLFIKLQNDLLNVKIFKLTQGDDIRQTRMFLKELYDQTKSVNQFLAIRIGFELYDIFLKENRSFPGHSFRPCARKTCGTALPYEDV